ncbi:MAG: glycosyltransferase family 2 protein [Bacteroidaceae bacterium]|nr:glycosyltransferase family 2 protein [Bacteroidaceae bacterium]
MNNCNKMISVVINTYNAAATLEGTLKSVLGFDEILVCDMESTDNTVQIAQSYNCKVVTFPKAHHCSAEPARTFAIQSAANKWVLVVDADEVVTPELKDYLYQRIKEDDCPAGIYIPRKNYFMNTFMRATWPDYQLRFFIKEGTVWPPYVHTFPVVQGRLERIPRSQSEKALLHNDPNRISVRIKKTNEYTENELDKKSHQKLGVAALLWRPAYRFFKAYILKKGFLDGLPGFIWAVYEAIYQFVIVSKSMERRIKGGL